MISERPEFVFTLEQAQSNLAALCEQAKNNQNIVIRLPDGTQFALVTVEDLNALIDQAHQLMQVCHREIENLGSMLK